MRRLLPSFGGHEGPRQREMLSTAIQKGAYKVMKLTGSDIYAGRMYLHYVTFCKMVYNPA